MLKYEYIVSQRGVVFFRKQDNLTNDLQKTFIQRLGELSGKPSTSTLHIHPILNGTSEFGAGDNTISTISSLQRKKLFGADAKNKRRYDSARWHSDIQFEECPADVSCPRPINLSRKFEKFTMVHMNPFRGPCLEVSRVDADS